MMNLSLHLAGNPSTSLTAKAKYLRLTRTRKNFKLSRVLQRYLDKIFSKWQHAISRHLVQIPQKMTKLAKLTFSKQCVSWRTLQVLTLTNAKNSEKSVLSDSLKQGDFQVLVIYDYLLACGQSNPRI